MCVCVRARLFLPFFLLQRVTTQTQAQKQQTRTKKFSVEQEKNNKKVTTGSPGCLANFFGSFCGCAGSGKGLGERLDKATQHNTKHNTHLSICVCLCLLEYSSLFIFISRKTKKRTNEQHAEKTRHLGTTFWKMGVKKATKKEKFFDLF